MKYTPVGVDPSGEWVVNWDRVRGEGFELQTDLQMLALVSHPIQLVDEDLHLLYVPPSSFSKLTLG